MSDVKRLPDKSGWWWNSEFTRPLWVSKDAGGVMHVEVHDGEVVRCAPGQWIPCPEPEWPLEPPPRPRMVWASCFANKPTWWVLRGDRCDDGCMTADAEHLTPRDHPDQTAEEGRRILAEK